MDRFKIIVPHLSGVWGNLMGSKLPLRPRSGERGRGCPYNLHFLSSKKGLESVSQNNTSDKIFNLDLKTFHDLQVLCWLSSAKKVGL